MFTPYQRKSINIGRTYVSDLDLNCGYSQKNGCCYIEKGIHSFMDEKDAIDFISTDNFNMESIVVKCIIPRGA